VALPVQQNIIIIRPLWHDNDIWQNIILIIINKTHRYDGYFCEKDAHRFNILKKNTNKKRAHLHDAGQVT